MLGAFFMSFCRVGTVGVVHWSPKPGRESGGSNPSPDAKYVSVAEWLRTGLQIRVMQVRVLSLTPIIKDRNIAKTRRI